MDMDLIQFQITQVFEIGYKDKKTGLHCLNRGLFDYWNVHRVLSKLACLSVHFLTIFEEQKKPGSA